MAGGHFAARHRGEARLASRLARTFLRRHNNLQAHAIAWRAAFATRAKRPLRGLRTFCGRHNNLSNPCYRMAGGCATQAKRLRGSRTFCGGIITFKAIAGGQDPGDFLRRHNNLQTHAIGCGQPTRAAITSRGGRLSSRRAKRPASREHFAEA